MKGLSPVLQLEEKIQLLELERRMGGKLKEDIYIVAESFKPVNLITSTLSDMYKSPFLNDNLLGTVMGLASGFLTKKIFIGSSGNMIIKLMVSILQFGVTNEVAQNSEIIKSLGKHLFQHILHKKESDA
jgi:hypothetical protein